MAISFDKAFGLHPDAMLIRDRRAQVLAENIANADTPGYKAKDLDFQQALSNAQARQSGDSRGREFAHRSPGGLQGSLASTGSKPAKLHG